MNKIFKVIYNNAKHCYVVASEFAKSYTKGGGSRTIRRVVASLGLAAVFYAASGIAIAENSGGQIDIFGAYVGKSPYIVTIDTSINGDVFGRFETNENGNNASVSVDIGNQTLGKVCGGYSQNKDASFNCVTIKSGIIDNLYGGFSANKDAASNSVSINSGIIDYVYGGYSVNKDAFFNSVTIKSGTFDNVFGGDSENGNSASNSITIKGDTTVIQGCVYGGCADTTGIAKDNLVDISNGSIDEIVYGGFSFSGNADSNSVIISGGHFNSNVTGGFSVDANAINNSLTISGKPIIEDSMYGGNSEKGSAVSNSVNISIDDYISFNVYGGYVSDTSEGLAKCNKVSISSGTIYASVFGGYSEGNSDANENHITMTGGKIDKNIYNDDPEHLYGGFSVNGSSASNSVNISGSSTFYGSVYGGYVKEGTGSASYNLIDIKDDVEVGTNVYGGYSKKGKVASNSVIISGKSAKIDGEVYGGYVEEGTGSAIDNQVRINKSEVLFEVFGGYSKEGEVASNSVNISGSSIIYDAVYGGYVKEGSGSAIDNQVRIENSDISNCVYGGYSLGGTGATIGNHVSIENSIVRGAVYGGFGENGNSTNNSVYINGGEADSVIGGYSKLDVTSNYVNINSGTVNTVYGGKSESSDTASNSVNINGGTVNNTVIGGLSIKGNSTKNSINISGGTFGSGSNIYCGYISDFDTKDISDNIVNLSGVVKGLDNVKIFGFYNNTGNSTHAGNELHIGRSVEHDDNGKIKLDTNGENIYKSNKDTIWQGKSSDGTINNKIKEVSNFETIALHNVAWNTSLPVLAADSFNYDNNPDLDNSVTLDTTDINFNDYVTGTMVLLQSETDSNFTKLNLKYSKDENFTLVSNSGQVVWSADNQTLTKNGINFKYDTEHSIFSSDDDKKVNYKALNTIKTANLGSMKWSEGGYTIASTDAITAGGLVVSFGDGFKVDGAESKDDNSQLTLLDLSDTTGTIKEAVSKDIKLAIQKDVTDELTFKITRTDTASSDSQLKKVVYTVGKNNAVSKAIFNSSINWNSETPYYNNTAFDFTNNSEVAISKLEFAFSNEQKAALSNTSIMTLVDNATNQQGNAAITYKNNGIDHSQEINYTSDNGVALSGTMSGVVNTSNSEISFAVNQMTLDSVNLKDWNNESSAVPAGWTKGDSIEVKTGDELLTGYEETKTILTSDIDGCFSRNTVFTGVNIYSDDAQNKSNFNSDTDKGVTLDGYKLKGIKASNDGKNLIYAVDPFVTKISLGNIDSNSIRDMNNSLFDFSDVDSIDASDLKLTFTNDQVGALSNTSKITLLTNAEGLQADREVTYKEGVSGHTQAIGYNLGNGSELLGTLSGTISNSNGTIDYSVGNINLDSINIANWNDAEDASAILDNWSVNSDGVKINAPTFNPTITTGEKTILTFSTSIFKDENIDESIRFAEKGSFNNDSDKGVNFSGIRTGGVKATDEGKSLTYFALRKEITEISLKEMKWGEGRIIDPNEDVSFNNVAKIDAKELKFIFANEQTENLAKGSGMEILSNAKGLPSGVQVIYKGDANFHSQAIDYNTANGLSLLGSLSGTISTSDNTVNYAVTGISLDKIMLDNWNDSEEASAVLDSWTANSDGVKVSATTFNPTITTGEKTILTASNDIFKDENIDESIKYKTSSFKDDLENGVSLSGDQTGGVKASDDGKALTYFAIDKTINKFDLANWDGENEASVENYWKFADGTSVDTDGMSNLPVSETEKEVFILRSDEEGYFAKVALNGKNLYGQNQIKFTESDNAKSIVLSGTQDRGVILDDAKKNIIYKVGTKDVTSIKLNTIAWENGAELFSRDAYNYSKFTTLDTKDFNIAYEKPELVLVNQSMTLLKANDTFADMEALDKSVTYQYEPVSGVILDAIIRSSLEAKSGKISLTAVSNNAEKLTFGDIDWLDKGALIDHKTMLNNVSFEGAEVDTSKISFINKGRMEADMQMTLVSDFDGNPSNIIGDKYKVGTVFEGKGCAYMEGNDLVFKTLTPAGLSDETHSIVMAMEAGVSMVNAAYDNIGNVIEDLGSAANMSSDGVATSVSMGGGASSIKTGSHVDTNSWNCVLAVGKNLEKKDGTFEYGLFAEYGRGNYSLHMTGMNDSGSGNTHYTGGGLLSKWTNKHDVYTEASFRFGNMKDNAFNLVHDLAGVGFGYNVKAKYRGGHFGIGKICREDGGTKLDVYSKFFYNQREGINFDVGYEKFSLEDVRSRILRSGFRYSTTERKWNRYGGIAYDYEFGGKSNGNVNGVAIRPASIKGGTLRGEFGYCREATNSNPWKTDISLYGFTGKRNGFGGSVAFEYHF